MDTSNSRKRRSSQSQEGMNPPKIRRVTNTYKARIELSNDNPPSVRLEGYRSPHRLTAEGDRIEVWREGVDKYYRGTVRSLQSDGKHRVEYDDGNAMHHFLSREVYTFTGKALERFLAQCFAEDARRHWDKKKPVHYPFLVDFLEVGHRVRIYLHMMRKWYPALITGKDNDGSLSIAYDDGDIDCMKMNDVTFRFIEDSAAVVHTLLMEEFLGV